jgi:hypothetical protein
MRALILLLLLAASGAVMAQTPSGDQPRGSVPPGTAADGSRPADGAIKGGSIAPGERGGQPDKLPSADPNERQKRCLELSGTLRDQCLLKERDASAGGSRPDSGAKTELPAETPPPQNPR